MLYEFQWLANIVSGYRFRRELRYPGRYRYIFRFGFRYLGMGLYGCYQANKQTGQEAAEWQQLRFGLGLGLPVSIVIEAAI